MKLPYQIQGIVVEGKKRGRLLGYPTANIQLLNGNTDTLESGVFTSTIDIRGLTFKAATSIGAVLTFDQEYSTVESHIIDFNQDIYGLRVVLILQKKIRDMKKFNHVDELIKQIQVDVETTKLLLS